MYRQLQGWLNMCDVDHLDSIVKNVKPALLLLLGSQCFHRHESHLVHWFNAQTRTLYLILEVKKRSHL